MFTMLILQAPSGIHASLLEALQEYHPIHINATKELVDTVLTTLQQEQPDAPLSSSRCLDKIVVHNSEAVVILPVCDIVRLQGEGHYTTFFMSNGEKVLASKCIGAFDSLLSDMHFYRVHQSHLIHLPYVYKFLKEDGGWVCMRNGDKIPVARRKKDEFLEVLTR